MASPNNPHPPSPRSPRGQGPLHNLKKRPIYGALGLMAGGRRADCEHGRLSHRDTVDGLGAAPHRCGVHPRRHLPAVMVDGGGHNRDDRSDRPADRGLRDVQRRQPARRRNSCPEAQGGAALCFDRRYPDRRRLQQRLVLDAQRRRHGDGNRRTGRHALHVRVAAPATAIAACGGVLVIAYGRGWVGRFDYAGQRLSHYRYGWSGNLLACDGDHVWLDKPTSKTLVQLDLPTLSFDWAVKIGGKVTAITAGHRAIWVALANHNTIIGIDADTEQLLGPIRTMGDVRSLSYFEGQLWALHAAQSCLMRSILAATVRSGRHRGRAAAQRRHHPRRRALRRRLLRQHAARIRRQHTAPHRAGADPGQGYAAHWSGPC